VARPFVVSLPPGLRPDDRACQCGREMPPTLHFSEEEMDALLLGLHVAARSDDEGRADAARTALLKLAGVLPRPEGKPPEEVRSLCGARLAAVAEAVHGERVLVLSYADAERIWTERRVWPVRLELRGSVVLLAWCELREDFRHFRLDRVAAAEATGEATPRRRREMLAEWEAAGEWEG